MRFREWAAMSQPFTKHDAGKLRLDLISPEFLEGLGAILTLGAVKYSPKNWQNCTEPFERYYSALQRHLLAFARGERTDAESGRSHLYHAAACLMFLEHFERTGALDVGRSPKEGDMVRPFEWNVPVTVPK
jgi:hypothetical protein